MSLDDGGVWITNSTKLALGRFNPTIHDITGGLIAGSAELDVRQEAEDILLVEPGHATVIDPANVDLSTRVDLPAGAQVEMASGVVLVSDPRSGNAWVRSLGNLATLRVAEDDPDLELGLGGAAMLDVSGDVHALKANGEELLATLQESEDGEGEVAVETVRTREAAPSGSWQQVTTVGDELVAYDGSVLSTPAGQATLVPRAVLQRPGEAADRVAVAAANELIQVELDNPSNATSTTVGQGTAAAPVRVGACVLGAWASSEDNYVTDCGDGVQVTSLEAMDPTVTPVFRVNRGRVVLNDVKSGDVWMPLDDAERVSPPWDSIEDPEDPQQNQAPIETPQTQFAECTDEISDPLATPDSFGVRAGSTIVLPVLDNDSTQSCGVLAVSGIDGLPESFGSVVSVYNGRALQLTVMPNAEGVATFRYTVTDGRATTTPAQAEVTLTVNGPGDHAPPVQVRTSTLAVEQGGFVRHDVLADFADPNGDDIYLVSASVAGEGAVSLDADGLITFRPLGSGVGRQTITVTVTDGDRTADGLVEVDVNPASTLAPLLGPVHAVTTVNRAVTVEPLTAVLSQGSEPPRLAQVGEVPGLTLNADLAAGRFTATAAAPGSYMVAFVVASGSQESTGIARIDVLPADDSVTQIVATRDVVYLPAAGEATILPLSNDVSSPGNMLFLVDTVAPEGSPVKVATVSHLMVTVRQLRSFTEPIELTYTMTDGMQTAQGTIVVVPLPPSGGQSPPFVPDVEAHVRTGGVVTIPALAGAIDPDGDALTLMPDLVEAPAAGWVFVTGGVIRYQAPEEATTVEGVFAVTDTTGNVVSAKMRIIVHESDAESKAPPRPRDVESRVFAGEIVRIDLPMVGIDDDGDGVMLQGPATAPLRGRIVRQGSTWLEYEALPGESGTDTFRYAVEDWTGQRATASVRVVVSARPDSLNSVTAANDRVRVRPGQAIEVPVLDNDADSAGAALSIDPILEIDHEGVEASVKEDVITLTAPEAEGTVNIVYAATTASGGRDQAVLSVEVSNDALLLPPVAADVVVRPIDTIDRSAAEVDVLTLARNPSGPISDLEVSIPEQYQAVASVNANGAVVVTLGSTTRTVAYRLTNTAAAEPVSAVAFVTVPALGDFPPLPRPKAPLLRVISGEELQIELSEHVLVAPGKQARVGDQTTAAATRSDGTSLVVDSDTLRFVSAAGYAGPASLTIEIADGDPSVAGARTSLMTFSITVLAAEAYPPTFTPTTLEVSAGDTPVTVDLAALTTSVVDKDGADQRYTYTVNGATPAGFDTSLNDSILTVAAPATTTPGTRGTIRLDIAYGGGEPVAARVELLAVATRRPLASVANHDLPDGRAGETVTVNALAGAFNPFPGTPLELVSATLIGGTANVSISGGQVLITPDVNFVGVATITYRVMDATGDETRAAEGTIRLTVRGRPSVPTAPVATEVGDRMVVLRWTPPAANGAEITSYQVTASPGGVVTTCAATTCTISNLVNDTEYTFTLTATNEVGISDPSPASGPARPDVLPLAPGRPTANRGDTQITVTWPAAVTTGSPIESYTVELTPGSGAIDVPAGTLSYTFAGLTNGTEYQVRVRAKNRLPEPGPWSDWSAPVIPAGLPSAPGMVTATGGYSPTAASSIAVGWAAAGANGSAIVRYEVSMTGPAGTSSLEVGGLNHTFAADVGPEYAFQVRALNDIGWSAWSEVKRARTWTAPGTPGVAVPVLGTGDAAGTVTLTWSAPDTGGSSGIASYVVTLNGQSRTVSGGQLSETFTGFVGPATITSASVTATNTDGATGAPGSWGGLLTVTTKPVLTSVEATLTGTPANRLGVEWSVNDGGSALTDVSVAYRRDGGAWQTPSVSTGATFWQSAPGLAAGTYEVQVFVTNVHGNSATLTDTVTIEPEPTDPPTSPTDPPSSSPSPT